MSDTRRKALAYLGRVVGDVSGKLISASKFFEPQESWTQKETWWFNLPIKKIRAKAEKITGCSLPATRENPPL